MLIGQFDVGVACVCVYIYVYDRLMNTPYAKRLLIHINFCRKSQSSYYFLENKSSLHLSQDGGDEHLQ